MRDYYYIVSEKNQGASLTNSFNESNLNNL